MRLFSPRNYNTVPGMSVKDLNEKEFNAIYNAATIVKLDPGKALFSERNGTESLFVIIKGALMITKDYNNRIEEVGILREGDWLSRLDIFDHTLSIFSVTAIEPCTLLGLNDAIHKSLSINLQNLITKNITAFCFQVINWLSATQINLSYANQYLTNYVQDTILHQGKGYEESEIILSILRNVPRLPMYVNTLLNMLVDGTASSREVASLAGQDPSLVGEILKTVNSAYYGLRSKVADFHHAVVLLGFNQVYQLVVANGLVKTMPNTPEFRALYDHCVIISHLAFAIAQHFDRRSAPLMSTVALLHDIGESVVMLLKKQNPKWAILINVLDPAKLGAMLLKEWNIPADLYRVIEYQNYPRFLPPAEIPLERKENLAILHIAHLCYEYIQGNPATSERHPFINHYLRMVNLANRSIGDIIDKYLIPSLTTKEHVLAQHVRDFLTKAQRMRGAMR
jgi:HD-like signal output (HDOD) protein/CRP-like cAMP-binding protein